MLWKIRCSIWSHSWVYRWCLTFYPDKLFLDLYNRLISAPTRPIRQFLQPSPHRKITCWTITRSLTTDRLIGWTRSWVILKLSTTPSFMSSLMLVRYCSQHCSPGIFLVKFTHVISYSLQFASIDLSIVLLYYEIMFLTKPGEYLEIYTVVTRNVRV